MDDSFFTGKEFRKTVKKYSRDRSEKKNISTALRQHESYTRRTRDVEYAIERMLDTGRYTKEHMLVIRDPFCLAPLTAYILFVTEEPCRVTVRLEDGTFYEHTAEAAVRHRIPVLGLHAGRSNAVSLELKKGSKLLGERKIEIRTASLPKCFQNEIQIKMEDIRKYITQSFHRSCKIRSHMIRKTI